MDNKSIFASNLQKYMERNDKSRTDIAEALGISYYTVTDWVKGKKYPRMDKVERLAKYFGVKKSDLIEQKTIESQSAMAERHFEIVMDEDINEIFDDFRSLNMAQKKIVKDLVHSLAQQKTEA